MAFKASPWLLALLTATTLSFAGDDIDLTGTLSDEQGYVDDIVTVSLTLSFEGGDAQGFQWGICHDDEYVSVDDDGYARGTAIEDLSFTFLVFSAFDDGWACGSLLNPIIDEVLEEGDDLEFLRVDYELLSAGTAELEWCETVGVPATTNRVFFEGAEVEFDTTNDGSIEILEPPSFIRGDIDQNGSVSALTDALHLLEWHGQTGEMPVCMKAADVNDNGSVFPLTDALHLLLWAFQSGDEPPAPFDDCDTDPTEDEVGCDEVSDTCS